MTRLRLWRPSIEFNLTEHCNLRCTHCDQASSVLPKKFAQLDSFRQDIEVLSTVLEAGELKIGGGEALLHPQVIDFLKAAKEVRIARRLVLLTNGVLLHKAAPELWQLIDGIWISIYPGIKHRFDWDWIQQKADENNVWIWRKETPEFAQRLLVEEVPNQDLSQMVFENCTLAHFESCHTIHEGRYYMCSPSVWMEPRLALHGIAFTNRQSDGVPIHDNPNLYEDLDAMIRRKTPLQACKFCLGSWARTTPNIQMTQASKAEYLSRRNDNLSGLIDPEIIISNVLLQNPSVVTSVMEG